MISDRIPPHSIQTERCILGSMLIMPDVCYQGLELLSGEDFYRSDNVIVFEAIKTLSKSNTPADIITVSNYLRNTGKIEAVDESYLSELTESVSTTTDIAEYAEILKHDRIRRELIQAAQTISDRAYNGENDSRALMAVSERLITGCFYGSEKGKPESIREIIPEMLEQYEKALQSKNGITGIVSGITDLDQQTAGFQNGDLVIIAARPGHGKTAFALSTALAAWQIQNIPSIFFSLEMSKPQLLQRLIAMEASINTHSIRSGRLTPIERGNFQQTLEKIQGYQIFIDDTPSLNLTEIKAITRRMVKQNGVGLVIVDYLQFMGTEEKQANRNLEVGYNSKGLKNIAKEYNIPVLALSQLNRQNEQRSGNNHRPTLSDMRDSGSIEQDADVVIGVYWEYKHSPKSENKEKIELILLKQRQGAIGTIDATYIDKYTRFENKNITELKDEADYWQA